MMPSPFSVAPLWSRLSECADLIGHDISASVARTIRALTEMLPDLAFGRLSPLVTARAVATHLRERFPGRRGFSDHTVERHLRAAVTSGILRASNREGEHGRCSGALGRRLELVPLVGRFGTLAATPKPPPASEATPPPAPPERRSDVRSELDALRAACSPDVLERAQRAAAWKVAHSRVKTSATGLRLSMEVAYLRELTDPAGLGPDAEILEIERRMAQAARPRAEEGPRKPTAEENARAKLARELAEVESWCRNALAVVREGRRPMYAPPARLLEFESSPDVQAAIADPGLRAWIESKGIALPRPRARDPA